MAGRYDDDVGTKDGAGVRDGRGLEEGVATPGTTQPISRGLATWASAIVMLTAKGRSITSAPHDHISDLYLKTEYRQKEVLISRFQRAEKRRAALEVQRSLL